MMLRSLNHIARLRVIAFVIGSAAIGACTLDTDVGGPAALIRHSGNQQTAPTNTALPAPLAVLVVNQFGEPLSNVTVSWTIVSGGGSLSTAASQTDETGIASVIYTTGAVTGSAVIEAKVQGLPPLSFNVTIS